MTLAVHMRKSEKAMSSARQLLAANATKTHRGLIAVFGRHLVHGEHVAAKLVAWFNKVERLRLLADYTGTPLATKMQHGLCNRPVYSSRRSVRRSNCHSFMVGSWLESNIARSTPNDWEWQGLNELAL